MKSWFWNSEQNRLRMVCRFALLGVIGFISIILMAGNLISWGAQIYLLARGTSLEGLSEGVRALFRSSPWFYPLDRLFYLLGVGLTLAILARWIDRRPWADFGFHFNRRWWIDLGFGMLLGGLLMTLIFLVEKAAGWIVITEIKPLDGVLLERLIRGLWLFIVVGIVEEVFARGYFLKNLAEGLNFRWLGPRAALLAAFLGSSILFGCAHLLNPNTSWVSTVDLMLAGIFLGLGYVLTGELAIPIGLHITWNFFQGYIFGFPVSGGASGYGWIAIQQGGTDLWTGGAFGPEAGLIGVFAMLLGCAAIWFWVRVTHGKAELQNSIAEYRPLSLVSNRPVSGPVDEVGA